MRQALGGDSEGSLKQDVLSHRALRTFSRVSLTLPALDGVR
jgi:hypothetical protein